MQSVVGNITDLNILYRELRFLIHQSAVGGIIGKGGEKIKEIRNTSGANVKVFQNPAPQSTDRCVQVNRTIKQLKKKN